jgi:epoxide hydrolase 4
MIEHTIVENDGVKLHCAWAGASDAPPVILLHGFPDHWIGWRHQIAALAQTRLVIAPDGRGINLSDAPDGVEPYRIENLIADVLAIAEAFSPGQRFDLAGHDWGGVVAWALAQCAPERLRRLLVLNAPHPHVLGAALASDPEQQKRSAYIHLLRADGAEERLAALQYAPLLGAFAEIAAAGRTDDAARAAHLEAWARPGRLRAALNWYRAAAFLDDGGESWRPAAPLSAPTLLIWGAQDHALPPSLIEAHRRLTQSLEVKLLAGIGHWPHQEAPDLVTPLIMDWFNTID